MAIWWLTEAIPISWTACLPLLLYPLCGVFGAGFISNLKTSAEPFVDAYIFLFLGGMMIGAAMEECRLHRRVALRIMRVIGTDPKRLLLGMLVSTAAVSLWISNTATAVMMLPIGLALIAQLEAANGGRKLRHFGSAVMLAVAYASNVGGIGTKIGTSTNSIFCGFVQRAAGVDIGFMKYLALGLPFVVLFVPILWAVLWRLARKDDLGAAQGRDALEGELASMGPMSGREKTVAAIFVAAALLWIGGDAIRGWIRPGVESAFRLAWTTYSFETKHYEAGVAMTAGAALLALRLLSLASLRKLPWGTLVLLGGSFAMAAGIDGSGLSNWMALQARHLATLPLFWQIALASLSSVALTAVASNTGTVSVLLSVLPRSMGVFSASAIGASCDFMLPAGTPPNAIVFGSGYIRLPTMMKTGFFLDVSAVLLITLYTFFYARHLFA
jgi:sodium-dependent dicarboxylate transporter 2/3/5